ncbi:MAG TPA: hypothetical protein VEZ88_02130 [Steroidobacteraceae bacterium]|nr:hypothetical protein [Steroidobacteraceae bacterium]
MARRVLGFEHLPPVVRAALHEMFGAAAASVELIEHSWRVRWHARALATTRPHRIYLRGTVGEFARDPALVLHEYFHVLNQWAPRRLTRWRYVLAWLRRGYFENRFEIEAREFEAANQRRFRLLMARAEAGTAHGSQSLRPS